MASPLADILETIMKRLEEPNVSAKTLAQIIQTAVEVREGIFDAFREPGYCNLEGIVEDVEQLTRIMVIANHKAQAIVNPWFEMPPLEDEIREAMQDKELVDFREAVAKRMNLLI
jgi:hypothetical protein